MKVAVLGAGASGLLAAKKLLDFDFEVDLYEPSTVGGLAASYEVNGDKIPICYHHIMETDKTTREVLKELNIYDLFYEKRVKIGFLWKGKIFDLKGALNLLKFKPLSFSSRIKFGLLGLKCLFKRNWDRLNSKTAKDWIVSKAGLEVYEVIFKPLLESKFSNDAERIVASWVGHRLSKRESKGKFGYIRGGLDVLINTLLIKILDMGGQLIIKKANVQVGGQNEIQVNKKKYDKVIAAIPIPELVKSLEGLPENYLNQLKKVKYKQTFCATIGLSEKITDYYWTNLLEKYSFGAIFDHARLNPDTKNPSILYLFTYNDDFPKNLLDLYLKDLDKIFPDITKKIEWKKTTVMKYAKPVYEIDYDQYKPSCKTPIKNLFLAGIGLFPKIRNLGETFKTSIEAVNLLLQSEEQDNQLKSSTNFI